MFSKIKNLTLFTFLLGMVAACSQAPKSDEAKTGEAEKVVEKPKAEADAYQVDVAKSIVTWVGTKPTGKHDGTFPIKEGKLALKDGQIVGGEYIIDLTQLKVLDIEDKEQNEKLTTHLKSNDFFNVEKFPTAKFVITAVSTLKTEENKETKAVEKDKEYSIENPTHSIKGNLELKGVTKSIEFPAKVSITDKEIMAESKFNIDRTVWGMNYKAEGSIPDKFIHNKVNIGFKIIAQKPMQ